MEQAPTVGIIAERLGVPLHRVEYIVKARKIQPAFRTGIVRVFDEQAIAMIERELKQDRRRKE